MFEHDRVRSGPLHIEAAGTVLSLVVECDVRPLGQRGARGQLYRPRTLYVISGKGVSPVRVRYLPGAFWLPLLGRGRKPRNVRRPATVVMKAVRSEADREPLRLVMGEPAYRDGKVSVPLRAVLATGGDALTATRRRYRLRRATTILVPVGPVAGR